VKGLEFINDGQHAANELITFEVGYLAEDGCAAQMSWIEGIASGATQGAFFGYFYGNRWGTAGQDSHPGV
jgi:hypothetical protein